MLLFMYKHVEYVTIMSNIICILIVKGQHHYIRTNTTYKLTGYLNRTNTMIINIVTDWLLKQN